jgi:hypothetical protein
MIKLEFQVFLYQTISRIKRVFKRMVKNIVTARSGTEQIFIQCKDFKDAWNVAGKLHRIELKEHTYTQIRLRGSPVPKKLYKDMTSMFLEGV